MEKQKIQINKMDEAISFIKDKDLMEIYKEFKKYFTGDFTFIGTFISKQEVLSEIQERIIERIREEFTEIKSLISEIRKKGQDVLLIDLEALSIPLKINILKAEFSLINLRNILSILESVKKKISQFKRD